MLICLVLSWKYTFWVNLFQKLKIVLFYMMRDVSKMKKVQEKFIESIKRLKNVKHFCFSL